MLFKIENTIDFLEEELFSLNKQDTSLITDLKILKTNYNTLLNEKNELNLLLQDSESEKFNLKRNLNELNQRIDECNEKMENLTKLNSSLEEEVLRLRLITEDKLNNSDEISVIIFFFPINIIFFQCNKMNNFIIENEELKRTLQAVQKESSQYYEELQINLKKLQKTEENLKSEDELKEKINQLKRNLEKEKNTCIEWSRVINI